MITVSTNTNTSYLNYEDSLSEKLSNIENLVRSAPQNAEYRWGLFQILCITSNWTRAIKQLQAYSVLSKVPPAMAHSLKELIICETHRETCFKGSAQPAFFSKKEWHMNLLESNNKLAHDDLTASEEYRLKALESAPTVWGELNQQPFKLLYDADTRLGPTLEFYTKGMYYWISLDEIREVRISAPQTTVDLIWQAAECILTDGTKHHGFIPARYFTVLPTTDQHKLSTLTTWDMPSDSLIIGAGQKTWVTDSFEIATLDVRHLLIK